MLTCGGGTRLHTLALRHDGAELQQALETPLLGVQLPVDPLGQLDRVAQGVPVVRLLVRQALGLRQDLF